MPNTFEVTHRADRFIEEALSRLENRLRDRLPSILGYSKESIARRLAQIVARDFYPRLARLYCAMGPFDQTKNMSLRLCFKPQKNRFSFERQAPSLKVSVPFILGRLCEMCAIFSYYFGSIMIALLRGSNYAERVTVFLHPGLGAYLDEDTLGKDFYAYTQASGITSLRETPRLLVQHGTTQKAVGHVHFSKSPWKDLTKHTRWTTAEIFQYVGLCVKTLSVSLSSFFRYPELSLLARDLGFHPFITLLSRAHKLDRVLLTTSGFLDQEIWLNHLPDRTFKTEMVWYASNTRPHRYNQSAIYNENPQMIYLQVDHAWTWNRSHANWLTSVTRTLKAEVCGPIVYSLPEARHFQAPNEKREKKFDLILFDVTPVSESWAEQNLLPGSYYYYKPENLKKFISDILEWAEEQSPPLRIGLKAKREYKSIHDQDYIQFIEKLGADKRLVVLPPKNNIFDVVSEAASIIVVPFSSPIYIGAHLGVPSLFYDASGFLDRPEYLEPEIGFANSRETLRAWLGAKLQAQSRPLDKSVTQNRQGE